MDDVIAHAYEGEKTSNQRFATFIQRLKGLVPPSDLNCFSELLDPIFELLGFGTFFWLCGL